jgi:hypothetical protein
MTAQKVFVAFTEIESGRHRDYNTWHQLDHRPENLALPGVIWGERWVKSPDCAKASFGADDSLTSCHYVTLYWFRAPVEASFSEWLDLGARSYQWGRRPELPYVKRPFGKTFVPVQGYVHPRVLVSADVLPLRPNRGVYISISDISGDTIAVEELFEWYNEVRIPDLLSCRGVAGAWTLVSEDDFRGHRPGQPTPTSVRVTVLFLDDDPVDVVAEIESRSAEWEKAGRDHDVSKLETVRFASPLRSIVPWQWDWFD